MERVLKRTLSLLSLCSQTIGIEEKRRDVVDAREQSESARGDEIRRLRCHADPPPFPPLIPRNFCISPYHTNVKPQITIHLQFASLASFKVFLCKNPLDFVEISHMNAPT